MTEKTIQSLETAMENIAESIETMTKGENVNYKDVVYRINAITRMNRLLPQTNRLLPWLKETAPSESDDSNGAE